MATERSRLPLIFALGAASLTLIGVSISLRSLLLPAEPSPASSAPRADLSSPTRALRGAPPLRSSLPASPVGALPPEESRRLEGLVGDLKGQVERGDLAGLLEAARRAGGAGQGLEARRQLDLVQAALAALAEQDEAAGAALIARALDDQEPPAERLLVLGVLARAPAIPGCRAALETLAQDPHEGIRERAAEALAKNR